MRRNVCPCNNVYRSTHAQASLPAQVNTEMATCSSQVGWVLRSGLAAKIRLLGFSSLDARSTHKSREGEQSKRTFACLRTSSLLSRHLGASERTSTGGRIRLAPSFSNSMKSFNEMTFPKLNQTKDEETI
jgi:hypothetical protein